MRNCGIVPLFGAGRPTAPNCYRCRITVDRSGDRQQHGVRNWGIVLLLLVTGSGCKEELKGGPRADVVPVTGKLLVDGKPMEGIAISFTRTSDRGVNFAVPNPEGMTDKDGVISATTYLIGDGCPPGDYTLTFQWTTVNPLTGSTGGDKFRGKFTNMEKSQHKVTIPKSNKAHDLGTIELSTK